MAQSRRIAEIQTPVIPIVGDLVRNTPGAISLGQGMVYYGPPPEALDAAAEQLGDPAVHRYGPVGGSKILCQLLADKLAAENRVKIGSDNRVFVTAGANMGFTNAVLAIADVGDEVIIQTPYYFNHQMAIGIAGCKAVLVETDDEYQLKVDAIAAAITERTRAVVTISPNNPTGAVYREEALREVNEICRKRGIYHIHDEAYEYFTYGGVRCFSPASIDGSASHTISLYSFSKSYGFAGWRVGYMVIPADLEEAMRKIQDTILICPTIIAERAAIGALKAGARYCRERLGDLAEVREFARREFLKIADLSDAPITDGAFYIFLKLHSEIDPLELVRRLVAEHKVAAMPGTAFGYEIGSALRVSYGALDKNSAAEGIGRLVGGLRTICQTARPNRG